MATHRRAGNDCRAAITANFVGAAQMREEILRDETFPADSPAQVIQIKAKRADACRGEHHRRHRATCPQFVVNRLRIDKVLLTSATTMQNQAQWHRAALVVARRQNGRIRHSLRREINRQL